MKTQFIGCSITGAAFHASTRHPKGESFVMMSATYLRFPFRFFERRTTKLGRPDHQSLIEQAT